MLTSGPPLRVPPKPPPSLRGSQPFTVLARSTSTNTLRPSIFLPSACLYAAKRYRSEITVRQWTYAPKWLVYEVYVPTKGRTPRNLTMGWFLGLRILELADIKILNCLDIRIRRYWIWKSFVHKQKFHDSRNSKPDPRLHQVFGCTFQDFRRASRILWYWTMDLVWSNKFWIYETSEKVKRPTEIDLDADSRIRWLSGLIKCLVYIRDFENLWVLEIVNTDLSILRLKSS